MIYPVMSNGQPVPRLFQADDLQDMQDTAYQWMVQSQDQVQRLLTIERLKERQRATRTR